MNKLEIGMKIHYHPWKNKKNIGPPVFDKGNRSGVSGGDNNNNYNNNNNSNSNANAVGGSNVKSK
jgi:hypothetical protein